MPATSRIRQYARPKSLVVAPMRILLVEDTPEVADCVVMALEVLGHTAVHASTTAQAMHLLKGTRTFDAAMLDVNMGAETTADLATVLTEGGIPYVVASGRAPDDIPGEMTDGRHLRKPYLLDDLERALRTCRLRTAGPRD